MDPDRQPFPTADGYVSIVAYTDASWQQIFTLLDQPDYLEQQQLLTSKQRYLANAQLYRAMASFAPALATAEIIARCKAAQIPAQAVRDLDEVMDDPHLDAIEFFRRRKHSVESDYFEQPAPVRFGVDEIGQRAEPPLVGADSAHVRQSGWAAFGRPG